MEAGGYSHPWVDLAPRFQWRPSQRHLLELAGHVCDRRWHLCAPPGAGKTLIGLELARRVATPTLVLAPTIAVRDQWRATRPCSALIPPISPPMIPLSPHRW
jgi:superfamily II DNA or RNA helicase